MSVASYCFRRAVAMTLVAIALAFVFEPFELTSHSIETPVSESSTVRVSETPCPAPLVLLTEPSLPVHAVCRTGVAGRVAFAVLFAGSAYLVAISSRLRARRLIRAAAA